MALHPGRTRIAPTPSGLLHVGNAINFLLVQRLAHETGRSILLRIDDLDAARVREDYLQDVFDSLRWLGIGWEEGPQDPADHRLHWSQQLRTGRYEELLSELRDLGVLYGCSCTRGQLAGKQLYPGTCRDRGLPLDDSVAWRLRLPAACSIAVPVWPAGEMQVDLVQHMGDVVLRQREVPDAAARPAYQIASLADDVDRAVDLVVRGVDLLPSTALQVHLARLLDLAPFLAVRFVHHGLVLDPEGRKLSKSEGASSLRALRAEGIPCTVVKEQADAVYRQLFS
jgi:glutamyl/glutaminyl-tRNA synthetase